MKKVAAFTQVGFSAYKTQRLKTWFKYGSVFYVKAD